MSHNVTLMAPDDKQNQAAFWILLDFYLSCPTLVHVKVLKGLVQTQMVRAQSWEWEAAKESTFLTISQDADGVGPGTAL